MKTLIASCVGVMLLAACGSEGGDHQLGASAIADASGATVAEEASCSRVDPCDADGPSLCTTTSAGCYLLYPNQRTVPVTCLVQLTVHTRSGGPTRVCP